MSHALRGPTQPGRAWGPHAQGFLPRDTGTCSQAPLLATNLSQREALGMTLLCGAWGESWGCEPSSRAGAAEGGPHGELGSGGRRRHPGKRARVATSLWEKPGRPSPRSQQASGDAPWAAVCHSQEKRLPAAPDPLMCLGAEDEAVPPG